MQKGRRSNRANKRIRVGDTVRVITGAHKDSEGKVLRIIAGTGRVVVEGVNRVKRHRRGQERGQGTIDEHEAPIHLSNIALIGGEGQNTRTAIESDEDGARQRVERSSRNPV